MAGHWAVSLMGILSKGFGGFGQHDHWGNALPATVAEQRPWLGDPVESVPGDCFGRKACHGCAHPLERTSGDTVVPAGVLDYGSCYDLGAGACADDSYLSTMGVRRHGNLVRGSDNLSPDSYDPDRDVVAQGIQRMLRIALEAVINLADN